MNEPVIPRLIQQQWSARKVFRRYLEHEREHTAHIQEILDQYRAAR